MHGVEPHVFLVGETQDHTGGTCTPILSTSARRGGLRTHPRMWRGLAEFMGRLCYRSFEPGLNPNVTRVRPNNAAHLKNIIATGHGSVLGAQRPQLCDKRCEPGVHA